MSAPSGSRPAAGGKEIGIRSIFLVSPELDKILGEDTVSKMTCEQGEALFDAQKQFLSDGHHLVSTQQKQVLKTVPYSVRMEGTVEGMTLAMDGIREMCKDKFVFQNDQSVRLLQKVCDSAGESGEFVKQVSKAAQAIDMRVLWDLAGKMERNKSLFAPAEFQNFADAMQLATILQEQSPLVLDPPEKKELDRFVVGFKKLNSMMHQIQSGKEQRMLLSPMEMPFLCGSNTNSTGLSARAKMLEAFNRVGITEPMILEMLELPSFSGKKTSTTEVSTDQTKKRQPASEAEGLSDAKKAKTAAAPPVNPAAGSGLQPKGAAPSPAKPAGEHDFVAGISAKYGVPTGARGR